MISSLLEEGEDTTSVMPTVAELPEPIILDEDRTPTSPLSTGNATLTSSSISHTVLAENVNTVQHDHDGKEFISCGTQWLAADTGDALRLKDHTYCCVPPWNPQPIPFPLTTQPLTSTPKKSPSSPLPPFFDLDDDITDITLSSVDDDGNDSSFQVSFEELDDSIESDAENPVDSMGKYENMCSVPKYIVFEDELLKLFKLCAICGEGVLEKGLVKRGSALKVTTLCKNSHTHEWNSQPQVKRAAAGNLLLSGAILFTGNTFSRASEMASIVNLAFPGESDYLQYQNKHLFPVINERWQQEKASVLTDLLDRESVTLLGDGRCDSPGYSAKYGTYTLMDEETKKIVDFEVSHVKQTTSSQAKKKECKDLAPWIKSITNHLWWSSMTCEGNPQLLKEKWTSILHHVVDKHEWDSAVIYNRCPHDPIPSTARRKTKWLKEGSPAHEALKQVVLDKRLLNDLQLLSKFIHTGALEVYHSLYNKYLPKRQHFGFKAMVARSQLAALDHNSGAGRKEAASSSGDKQYRYVFPKGMKDWVVKPVFEKKTKPHVAEMLSAVLESRATGEEPEPVAVPDLPKNIAPVPRPPKEELQARHASRFGKTI